MSVSSFSPVNRSPHHGTAAVPAHEQLIQDLTLLAAKVAGLRGSLSYSFAGLPNERPIHSRLLELDSTIRHQIRRIDAQVKKDQFVFFGRIVTVQQRTWLDHRGRKVTENKERFYGPGVARDADLSSMKPTARNVAKLFVADSTERKLIKWLAKSGVCFEFRTKTDVKGSALGLRHLQITSLYVCASLRGEANSTRSRESL